MIVDQVTDELVKRRAAELADDECVRHIVLTPASAIQPRPVHWLWRERMPLGELTLLAGREGIGKSTVAYTLAAWITTGTMRGRYLGSPRAVLVAATEDSWEHTIVPRLMAAGANLDLIFRVDVVTSEGLDGMLTLPSDLIEMERVVAESGAALILLDPLMSRLDGRLDTHKDSEVRRALEPLTGFAKRAHVAVLGLIHVSKSSSTDPLTTILASRDSLRCLEP
jgi:RecA-family ATPase